MRFYHLMKWLFVAACVCMAHTTVRADEYDKELENIESSFEGTPLVVSHSVDISSSKLSTSPSVSAPAVENENEVSLLETTSSRPSPQQHDGMTRGGAADALRLAAARAHRRSRQQKSHRRKYGSQHGRAIRRRQQQQQQQHPRRQRQHQRQLQRDSHFEHQPHGFLQVSDRREFKSRRGRTVENTHSKIRAEQKAKARSERRKTLGLRSLLRRKNNPFPHQESFYGIWDPVKDEYKNGVDESQYVPGLFSDRHRHIAALRPAGMTRAPFCATFPFCKYTPPPPPIHGLPVEPAAPTPTF